MAQRVLITRPVEDAAVLTQLLLARGCDVVHEPMFSIRFRSQTIDIADVQAVLISSANGARALAAATATRSVPVFAVGNASGKTCQEHGFNDVTIAGGTVTHLSRLVKNCLRPENGALLHVTGSVTAGNLSGQLRQAGFVVRKTILYETHPTTTLATSQLIADGAIDAALFYSPQTAAIFSTLVSRTGVGRGLVSSRAYCLSEAVRYKLSELPWRLIRVATLPDQESLLNVFDTDLTTLSDNTSCLTKKEKKEEDLTRHQAQDESMSSVWNAQTPRPITSSEADTPNEIPGETVRQPLDTTQKLPEKKQSSRGLAAALLTGAILIVATSIFIGWISQPWGRHSLLDRFSVPTHTNDFLGMELQNSLTSLRHDLDEVIRQLDEQRKRHNVLEQNIFSQEKVFINSREINNNNSENSEDFTINVLGSVRALETAIKEWNNTETRRLESLTHQTTALEARLSRFGNQIDTLAREQVSAVTLAEVHDRLTSLEEKIATFNINRDYISPKWLLSIMQLKDAIDRGVPFKEELHSARALAKDVAVVDRAVTDFIAYAATGLPTSSALTTRFEKLHSTIARVSLSSSTEGNSWLAQVLQRLQEAITIRRTDGSTSKESNLDDTLIIMSKASTALHAGDLLETIRMMESLRGKPAQVAAGWMAFARARAAAHEALSRLTAHALGGHAASHVEE